MSRHLSLGRRPGAAPRAYSTMICVFTAVLIANYYYQTTICLQLFHCSHQCSIVLVTYNCYRDSYTTAGVLHLLRIFYPHCASTCSLGRSCFTQSTTCARVCVRAHDQILLAILVVVSTLTCQSSRICVSVALPRRR